MTETPPTYVAFLGSRLLAAGPLPDIARAAKAAEGADASLLVFDAATSAPFDLDLSGAAEDVAARYAPAPPARGRPKLGVAAREVTLLPRHWDWLGQQPGGASVALRKLVEAATRDPRAQRRAAQEATYKFMSAIAGDFPGFEEAARALFAGDNPAFAQRIGGWPADIVAHLAVLAAPALTAKDAS